MQRLLPQNLRACSLTTSTPRRLAGCRWSPRFALAALFAAVLALQLHAAVEVTLGVRQEIPTAQGKRVVQPVTLANEVSSYTLTYDIVELPDRQDEITSHWWIWTLDYVTLGMTEPSQANWYFQGFFNWYFDGEALHNRPAVMRVLRSGGQDGVVEYVWDTPKVRAVLRFALQSNSDKLLLYGTYEAKQPVQESWLKLTCYPTGFAEPRQRAVTTAGGTTTPGETVSLDLARQHWVLYEDTTPQRPGSGPAGLIVGTPDAFAAITIPVGSYGIDTKLVLKPGAQSFALGFYDYPTLPDGEQARAYYRASADADAGQLQAVAAGGFLQPLPPGLLPESRRVAVLAHGRKLLEREVERWRPNPEPLRFSWAREHVSGPIRTVLFCPRYSAYETMELARRVDLQVEHLYWDSSTAICQGDAWPYAGQTGQGALGLGPAAALAAALCTQEGTELFLCAGISAASLPGPGRLALLQRVRAGAGLFLAGRPDTVATWPKELFLNPDPALSAAVLDALPWRNLPGFTPADPPIAAYRYDSGAVVVLRANLADYSALVPRHDDIEGRDGATDRCLALCARAVLAAAGRLGKSAFAFGDLAPDRRSITVTLDPALPTDGTLLARLTDDLDRELMSQEVKVGAAVATLPLPVLPGGRSCWLDLIRRDGKGRTTDMRSLLLPAAEALAIRAIDLEPVRQNHPDATPQVPLPAGGPLNVRVAWAAGTDLAGARVVCEVRDAFERVLARAAATTAGAEARLTLALPRPLTVCHRLDAWVERDGDVLAFSRRRFTLPLAYPYDDFTVLLWSYAGGEAVLQKTDRACYELGADMMDLCHLGGYDDGPAARQYELSSRSGLRVLPYVTRLSGEADTQHVRQPCLHDPEYLRLTDERLRIQARQAAPYSPAAFTLGDENYLLDSRAEGCSSPATMTAFRTWLLAKYGTLAALNAAWATTHADIAEITAPMPIEEAAKQSTSFAPWLDHRRFMDTAFAATHEHFAGTLQSGAPGAKVGWDGLLNYHWLAGYDFTQLCSPSLLLNQTYTTEWIQGELVRSLKAPGALTGKWGNADADNAAGFAAWPWTCLLGGDNSVWWWTSWGCDYIPFNPDLSPSQFGRWFFPAVRELTAGPGRLLLHATRRHSGIGVLYSQPDMLATTLLGRLGAPAEVAGDGRLQQTHTALLKLLHDLGYEVRYVSYQDLEAGRLPADEFRLVILVGALCLSDRQAATLRGFVEAGGNLLADGRTGLLTGDGCIRATAVLDELLGVTTPAGRQGLTEDLADATLTGALNGTPVRLLSPGLRLAGAEALWPAGEATACAVRRLGKGSAFTLNLPWPTLAADRLADGPAPLREAVADLLADIGLEPPARLSTAGGTRPKATRLTVFEDGALRYLGIEQDFRLPSLAEQPAHLVLPAAAVVYDLRDGRRIGSGLVREWDLNLSRGRPLLFSLLPYAVREVQATMAAAEVTAGAALRLQVSVGGGDATVGFHVVRLDVFAPGATAPHRQYSQNLACPNGAGSAEFPLALNDPPGTWRLELRDIASGVRAAPLTLQVRE